MSEYARDQWQIGERYEDLSERLAKRHQDLEGTLNDVKAYLTDVQAILTFLDDKELNTQPVDMLPTQEEEAKRKLDVCGICLS